MPKCGCKIVRAGAAIWIHYKIEYCPLHKAAPELLAAAEYALPSIFHGSLEANCRLSAAIAKAKGE